MLANIRKTLNKMIKKIIQISNVGRYINYSANNTYSEFSKNTIIYGDNGNGKTTLSLILKSLKGSNTLIKKKQTFGTEGNQSVKILTDKGIHEFKDDKWNKHNKSIEVFDIHYVEDNLFTGSHLPDSSRSNLFEIVVGQEGTKLKREALKLMSEQNSFQRKNKSLKNKLKFKKHTLTTESIDQINIQIEYLKTEIKDLGIKIRNLNKKIGESTKEIFSNHVEEINKQLLFFTPYLQIKKFTGNNNRGKQLLSYYLSISGFNIGFEKDNKQYSLIKYTLSEGDKSALAFSFFLAKLKISGNLENKIIVFDDPISSFDYSRRNATMNHLKRLSEKCDQLIVLSHDINFAKSLTDRIGSKNTLNLKIAKSKDSSIIIKQNIEDDTLSGIFKDISILKDYIENGVDSNLQKRDVIRCIRPIIEGIIRIKFFTHIKTNEWLGDAIRKIRESRERDPMFRLKPLIDELIDVNDYSKSFHHSDPTNPWGDSINNEELKTYVNMTLNLIQKI